MAKPEKGLYEALRAVREVDRVLDDTMWIYAMSIPIDMKTRTLLKVHLPEELEKAAHWLRSMDI